MTLSALVEAQIKEAQPQRSQLLVQLGVRPSSVVATATVLDRSVRCKCWSTLAMHIGRHLEWELAARRGNIPSGYAERHRHDNVLHKHLAYERLLEERAGPAPKWPREERMKAGLICLEACARAGLVERVSMGRRTVPRLTDKVLSALERQTSPVEALSAPPAPRDGPEGTLERVGWRWSGRMLEVLRELRSTDCPLVPPMGLSLPERPHDIATNPEARKEWRIAAHNARMKDIAARSRRARYLRLCHQREGPVYFPVTTDWRGRMYVGSSGPNYQSDEAARACLLFLRDHGWNQWAGLDWLQTVTGWDEELIEPRMEMVREDPIGNRWVWQQTKSPWLALQACLHWGDGRLPTALDASCHGMQILSAVARDRRGLMLTGCTTGHGDLYLEARDAVLPGASRDDVKPLVMTIPYGATEATAARHLVRKLGVRRDWANTRAGMLFDWLRKETPGAMMLVEWMQDLAGSSGAPLTWRAPDGRPCVQSYLSHRTRRINTRLFGRVRTGRLRVPEDRVDRQKARRAIVANYVHSVDATIAREVLRTEACHSIGVVHDCFLVPPSMRLNYINLLPRVAHAVLSQDLLGRLAEDLGAEPPFKTEGELPPFQQGMYR